MFTVLSEFADLQDGNHIYRVGDEYPRKGYSPTDERVTELSTVKNLLHKPLIQRIAVVEESATVVEEPVTVVEEVVQEAEEQPKRRRGRKNADA